MDFDTMHPLPDEIRAAVVQELRLIEHKHNVTVIYACESGSRAWGFASTNSDFDVRFIYVPKMDHYVNLDKPSSVIDHQIPELDLDMSGWALDKALNLMAKSNPALLEWLGSPLVYEWCEERDELTRLAHARFKSRAALGHYLSMAHKTWHSHIALEKEVSYKKYFYILRPIFAAEWVTKHNTMPPTEYEKLLEDIDPVVKIQESLDRLMMLKRGGIETARGPRIPELDEFIERKLEQFGKIIMPVTTTDNTELNEFFRRTVDKYD